MIPASVSFIGKKIENYPATLHGKVLGQSVEKYSPWEDFTIHQRFRKKGSQMEKIWGPIPENKKGLTLEVVENLVRHPDLQKIAALDTFVGNGDRSLPNVFYDAKRDQFYGIDMAASFIAPLAEYACNQISEGTPIDQEELEVYRETLKSLYRVVTPDLVANLLDFFTDEAGFCDNSILNVLEVLDRKESHKRHFEENYQWVATFLELLELRGT